MLLLILLIKLLFSCIELLCSVNKVSWIKSFEFKLLTVFSNSVTSTECWDSKAEILSVLSVIFSSSLESSEFKLTILPCISRIDSLLVFTVCSISSLNELISTLSLLISEVKLPSFSWSNEII